MFTCYFKKRVLLHHRLQLKQCMNKTRELG